MDWSTSKLDGRRWGVAAPFVMLGALLLLAAGTATRSTGPRVPVEQRERAKRVMSDGT